MSDLNLETKSFIQGRIKGWHPNTTYKLGDGTKWKLLTPTVRAFTKTNARIKLWVDDDGCYYLEIVGMGGKVRVSQVM